jgi:LacI family transcriptional regulator
VDRWVAELGMSVPQDVGLVHLDCSNETGGLSGINAQPEVIGAAAVDLLVGQLHAYEYGIPRREKIISVSGHWTPGHSLRRLIPRGLWGARSRKHPAPA